MTSTADVSPNGNGNSFTSENPARPSEIVGEYESASPANVSSALAAAAEAQGAWAARMPSERANLLAAVGHELLRNAPTFAELITREEGKPRSASQIEVRKAAEQFQFASQFAYMVEGTTYPSEARSVFTYTLQVPVGVVVAITPWNFPLSLPARKLAPALATGNAVVFKPSPATAATGELLLEVCRTAGIPPGVLQIVHGTDGRAMTTLLGDERVAAVTFTGSDAVGEVVRSLTHPRARLQAELGGHNGVFVAADADLNLAAKELAAAAFSLTGQACTAPSRALVEAPVYEEFCARLAAETRSSVAGPGTRADVLCGPVATRAQFERLSALRASALTSGRLLAEGSLVEERDAEGYWIAPIAVGDLPDDHDLATKEIFGPILPVFSVGDPSAAIDILNGSRHGLVAAVHTQNLGLAHRFAQSVQCGVVKVNQRTTGNGIAPPFGGWKSSSLGTLPEGGRQAIGYFTETKAVYLQY